MPLTEGAIRRIAQLEAETDQEIKDGHIQNIELQLSPFTPYASTTNRITQALARLLGYDQAGDRWRLVRVDAQGRLHVTTAPIAKTDFTVSSVNVGTSATRIVTANTERSSLLLLSVAGDVVYIGDEDGVTTSTGYPIYPYMQIEFRDYVGPIWAICGTTGSVMWYMEI